MIIKNKASHILYTAVSSIFIKALDISIVSHVNRYFFRVSYPSLRIRTYRFVRLQSTGYCGLTRGGDAITIILFGCTTIPDPGDKD